jgi:hypothetical protein
MAMHAQQLLPGKRFVEHHVVRSGEAPGVRYVDADPQDSAAVHSIGIWILEAESGYAGADAVQILFALREVF